MEKLVLKDMSLEKQSKYEKKREELHKIMLKYVTNGCIDLIQFREENKAAYTRVPYYFGSITNAINQYGWEKLNRLTNVDNKPVVSFKDRVAHYALSQLKEKYTLQTSGDYFGVSKACVRQLYNALDKNINQ